MERARQGKIAFIDHAWKGRRVLKVLCSDREHLAEWGRKHGLNEKRIHVSRLPHFDLTGQLRLKFLTIIRRQR